jgi:hypothetical protein
MNSTEWRSYIRKLAPKSRPDDMENLLLEDFRKVEKKNYQLKEVLKSAIPSLEDWIQTTSFGEVNRRDRKILADIISVLKEDN